MQNKIFHFFLFLCYRFDYVSELNYGVEKLREEIQQIKDNIQRVTLEDTHTRTACDKTVAELKVRIFCGKGFASWHAVCQQGQFRLRKLERSGALLF